MILLSLLCWAAVATNVSHADGIPITVVRDPTTGTTLLKPKQDRSFGRVFPIVDDPAFTYTLTFWIMPRAVNPDYFTYVFRNGNADSERGPLVAMHPSSTRLHIRIGIKGDGNWGVDPPADRQLVVGKWTHVALIVRNTNASVYLDAVLVAEDSMPTPRDTFVQQNLFVGGFDKILTSSTNCYLAQLTFFAGDLGPQGVQRDFRGFNFPAAMPPFDRWNVTPNVTAQTTPFPSGLLGSFFKVGLPFSDSFVLNPAASIWKTDPTWLSVESSLHFSGGPDTPIPGTEDGLSVLPFNSALVAARYAGLLYVPATGAYTFIISADDDAQLFVAGKNASGVVANAQIPGERLSAPITLNEGYQDIVVYYKQFSGNYALSVSWQSGLFERQLLAPPFLCYAVSQATSVQWLGNFYALPNNFKNNLPLYNIAVVDIGEAISNRRDSIFCNLVGVVLDFNSSSTVLVGADQRAWPRYVASNLGLGDMFGAIFEAFVNVVLPGNYQFFVRADNGSQVLVTDATGNTAVVVETYVPGEALGVMTFRVLSAGVFKVQVNYFDYEGPHVVSLFWKGPDTGNAWALVPANALSGPITGLANVSCPAVGYFIKRNSIGGRQACREVQKCSPGSRVGSPAGEFADQTCINCVLGLSFSTANNSARCQRLTLCATELGYYEIIPATLSSDRECGLVGGGLPRSNATKPPIPSTPSGRTSSSSSSGATSRTINFEATTVPATGLPLDVSSSPAANKVAAAAADEKRGGSIAGALVGVAVLFGGVAVLVIWRQHRHAAPLAAPGTPGTQAASTLPMHTNPLYNAPRLPTAPTDRQQRSSWIQQQQDVDA